MLEVDGKSEEPPLDGLATTLKKREPKWRLSNEKIGPSKDGDHKVSNIWLKDTTGARWFKRICEEGLILKQSFNMFEDKCRTKEDRDFLNGSAIEECLFKSATGSGYELKLVRGSGSKREECTTVMKVYYSFALVYFRL